MRRLTALALLALTAHATSPARTTFGKFARDVESICVGKVARVLDIPAGEVGGTVRVAEVEVLEWIKGARRPARIWYLAEGLIDADHSTAVPGERALFFLAEPRHPLFTEGTIDQRLASPAFRESLSEITGGAPLLMLGYLGLGRMPLEPIEGAEYANIETWLIRLPPDAITIQGPDPWLADMCRRVRFDYLRRLLERSLGPLTPSSGEAAAKAYRFLEALDTDMATAEELCETLDAEATLPVLLGLLDDPAYPRRETVAEALLWVAGEEPDSLLDELTSRNVVRRRAAAFALDAGIRLELVGPDDPVVEAVCTASADPDPEVRAYATGMLMRMDELDRWATALSDPSPRVRASARRSLLQFPDRTQDEGFPLAKSETALLAHAADRDVDVRREVWELLGFVAGPASRPATLEALADPDRVVRIGAVRALGRIGEANRLIGHLASEDAWVRRVAAYSLGQAQIAAGVGPLAKALGDADELVVRLAIDALGEIGPAAAAAVPALEALLRRPGGEHWQGAVEAALERIRG